MHSQKKNDPQKVWHGPCPSQGKYCLGMRGIRLPEKLFTCCPPCDLSLLLIMSSILNTLSNNVCSLIELMCNAVLMLLILKAYIYSCLSEDTGLIFHSPGLTLLIVWCSPLILHWFEVGEDSCLL